MNDQVRSKIFIISDHPLAREWLAMLIHSNSDLLACGESSDASGAITGIGQSQPDLAILDLSSGLSFGIELVCAIHSLYPAVKMIVLSRYEESVFAERTIRAGAHGFIITHESAGKIIEAMRDVLQGKMYVSSEITTLLAKTFVNGPVQPDALPISQLSDREFEVFELLGQGYEIMEIAETLRLSHKSIYVYCMRIRNKLKLKTIAELFREALRWRETIALG